MLIRHGPLSRPKAGIPPGRLIQSNPRVGSIILVPDPFDLAA